MRHNREDLDLEAYNIAFNNNYTAAASSSVMSEIEEVVDDNSLGSQELTPIREATGLEIESSSSIYMNGDQEEDAVYVVVGKDESSSMDALFWTLNNLFPSSSTHTQLVYLIHVFPEVNFIPSPLGNGKVPKSQVRPEQVETYMAQERGKRRELLQKFIDKCTASKVRVDTILIESDDVAKAIVELLFVLNIRKLVIGVSKSSLRLRTRKGNGTADQILQNAPHWCEIKCICEGKDAFDDREMVMAIDSTASPRRSSTDSNGLAAKSPPKAAAATTKTPRQAEEQHSRENSFTYCCFKLNAVNE
ncbi:hypothetical protein Ancab_033346 [Ancistrocladus abbreviatus]